MSRSDTATHTPATTKRPLTFEHRMMQLLHNAVENATHIHVYGNGFHLTGVVIAVNDRLIELRLADKTTIVRVEYICAIAV